MTNSGTPLTIWQRSPVARLVVRLGRSRALRRVGQVLAGLVVLIPLVYLEENWRGRWLWASFQREWEAKGEHFTLAALSPPPVPDEQNFGMAPIFRPLFDYEVLADKRRFGAQRDEYIRWHDTNGVKRAQAFCRWDTAVSQTSAPRLNPWIEGKAIDLTEWRDYLRRLTSVAAVPPASDPATDILALLRTFDGDLAELAVACRRPLARFPIHYEEGFRAEHFHHHGILERAARICELDAVAALALGRADRAFADVTTCLHLADALRGEPFDQSSWIRMSILQHALQPIWEGLATRRWSAGQLAALQSRLGTFDVLADYGLFVRAKRITITEIVEAGLSDRCEAGSYFVGGSQTKWSVRRLFYQFAPAGWFYQNLRSSCRLFQEALLGAVDPQQQRVYPRSIPEKSASARPRFFWFFFGHFYSLREFDLSGWDEATVRFAWLQTAVHEAITACALDRYRLANDRYPETLAELVPQFIAELPHDLINGEPLRYQRRGERGFVLYSVGWNERDNNGATAVHDGPTFRQDLRQGDWVWRYPTP